MFSYEFPAIKGVQANSEYYICMVPLKLLSKIFGNDNEYVPPQYRAQRNLNIKRIPEIKDYIIKNRDSYVFSALAASIDGNYFFNAENESNLGILNIDLDATFLINDGQHRKAAILEAIEEDESLKNETISIVFYADKGLSRSQQMFTDLNKHAVTTSKSLNTLYESREPSAMLAKKVVAEIPFFDRYTDLELDNLGDNSPNLFTLSNFYAAIQKMTSGMKVEGNNELQKYVIEYWKLVEKNINEWQEFQNKSITKKSLRKDYIIVYGIAILALGKLGNWLLLNDKGKCIEILAGLKDIDWRRTNLKDWKLRAVTMNGKIARSSETINLTYIRLKKLLAISLTKEEREIDRNVGRKI